MKLKIIPLVLVLFLFATQGFSAHLCEENGKLYSPVMEFTQANKHVLFVGMLHTGPKAYYPAARKLIENWSRRQAGKVAVLTEFFTCDSEAWDIPAQSKVTDAQIKSMQGSLGSGKDIPGFFADVAQRSKCVTDLDGKTSDRIMWSRATGTGAISLKRRAWVANRRTSGLSPGLK